METLWETPLSRQVCVAQSGEDARVEKHGVAIAGNGTAKTPRKSLKPTATAFDGGAAIVGDNAYALSNKASIAFGGNGARAEVGDGGVAKTGLDGHASSNLTSVTIVDDRGWAFSKKDGVAICRGGVAEVEVNGIACAYSRVPGDGERGIAIAGASGVAVAFNEGSVVCAGPGGVLIGYHTTKRTTRLVVEPLDRGNGLCSGEFYRFAGGAFHDLTSDEAKQLRRNLRDWKGKWQEK